MKCAIAGCKHNAEEGYEIVVRPDANYMKLPLCRRCFREIQRMFDEGQRSVSVEGRQIVKEEPGIEVVNTRGVSKIEFSDK